MLTDNRILSMVGISTLQRECSTSPLPKNAYSVPAAITHLKNYLCLPRSVPQGLAVLKQLDGNSPLYRLYGTYFPGEWACSTASLRARLEDGYTPREVEFLRLVERRLFPLDCECLLDMGAEGERMESIPLLSYATRWSDEPQEMDQQWQLLLIVSDSIYPDEALNLLQDMEETLELSVYQATQSMVRGRQGYKLPRLKQLCDELTGPLAHLALTFSLMLYETGNEWLDARGEDGMAPFDYMPLRWCEPHINLLTWTFREAQEMERRTHILADWLLVDLNEHMKSILHLLASA